MNEKLILADVRIFEDNFLNKYYDKLRKGQPCEQTLKLLFTNKTN